MMFEILAQEGKSSRYETLAAAVGQRLSEIRKQSVKESFSTIHQSEHRLEPVATVHGKEFINDSVSSTINSTWYALESFHRPIVWITGGVTTGRDFHDLVPQVTKKVRAIVCLGSNNKAIRDTFNAPGIPVHECSTMEEAVERAFLSAERGDVILLSPACPSFDLFANYEARGRAFRQAVKKL